MDADRLPLDWLHLPWHLGIRNRPAAQVQVGRRGWQVTQSLPMDPFMDGMTQRGPNHDGLLSLWWLSYQGLIQYSSLKALHLNSLPHASLVRSFPFFLEALYVAHAPAVVS